MAFEKNFQVSWAQLDANGHMANTSYLAAVVDVRFMYFESKGFAPGDWVKHRIGPVVRSDVIDYFRELRLLEPYRINMLLAGLSDDCSRFRFRNEIFRADGELAARVTSLGGMLDLAARKLVPPPDALAAAIRALDRSDDFAPLDSSVKK